MPNSKAPSRVSSRIAARNNLFGQVDSNGTQDVPTDHNLTGYTPNSSSSRSGLDRTVVSQNRIVPLMSLSFPWELGPRTTSSPGTPSTIPTPEYSSITAQEIRREFARMSRQDQRLPTVEENVNPDVRANIGGMSLRDYVDASVGAAQASMMRSIEQNLAVMIPQAIRNSLDSHVNSTLNNDHNRNGHEGQYHSQPRFNAQSYQQDASFHGQRSRQQQDAGLPNQQQPNPDFYRGGHTQYVNQNLSLGYKPMTPLQLQKWGLRFDGTSKNVSVEDFVFRAESLRIDYNCPWDIFVKGFHHFLTGRAYDWIWEFRQQNPYCQWDHLKYHLIKKFRNFESDFEIQRRMMERRQLPSETADSFITEVVKLRNQMRVQIHEYEIVRIIKDNLKDGLMQLVYPKDIETIEELLEECKRAERNIAKRAPFRQQQQNFRRVHELDYYETEQEHYHQEVEALQQTPTTTKQLTCWNCKMLGHSFIDCPTEQRNIFCFKCGFDGVTSPKCPKCLGNSTRNMQRTGLTCSKQSQTQ